MKSHTDLPQSKKLAEFLSIESVDMWYWEFPTAPTYNGYGYPMFHKGEGIRNIPCWSLAALMNLLPSEFTEKGEYSETTYKIDIRKYALTDDVDIYQIAYGNYKWHEDGSHTWSDMINTGEKEDLLDAVFQMIISLHKQKIL